MLESRPVDEATDPRVAVSPVRIPLSAIFGNAGFIPLADSFFLGGFVILRPLVADRVVSLFPVKVRSHRVDQFQGTTYDPDEKTGAQLTLRGLRHVHIDIPSVALCLVSHITVSRCPIEAAPMRCAGAGDLEPYMPSNGVCLCHTRTQPIVNIYVLGHQLGQSRPSPIRPDEHVTNKAGHVIPSGPSYHHQRHARPFKFQVRVFMGLWPLEERGPLRAIGACISSTSY